MLAKVSEINARLCHYATKSKGFIILLTSTDKLILFVVTQHMSKTVLWNLETDQGPNKNISMLSLSHEFISDYQVFKIWYQPQTESTNQRVLTFNLQERQLTRLKTYYYLLPRLPKSPRPLYIEQGSHCDVTSVALQLTNEKL